MKKGVKSQDGKYSPCWYSRGVMVNGLEAITVYAKDILKDLPRELGNVENNTEIITDYFEKDRVRFYAGTPEFNALVALVTQ